MNKRSITGNTIDDFAKEMFNRTNEQLSSLNKKSPKLLETVYTGKSNMLEYCEPKRNNRWVIKFPKKLSIPEFLVKSTTRPSYPFDINNSITVILYDSITPSVTKALINYVDFNDGSTPKTFNLKIRMLDPLGTTIETWKIKDAVIKQIDWSPLNYHDDSITTATIIINFNTLKIK